MKTLQGAIESISSEGMGVLRHEGQVIFVPYTAPGDEALVEITQVKKSYSIGKLLSLVRPSANRVSPLCRHFGICGGCQLQHIQYETQLEIKKQNVLSALQRIGKLSLDDIEIVSSKPYGYRRQVHLQLTHMGSQWKLGYVDVNFRLMPKIDECPIFTDEKDSFLWGALTKLVSQLPAIKTHEPMRLSVIKAPDSQFYLRLSANQRLPDAFMGIFKQLASVKPWWQGSLEFKLDELTIEYAPDAFVQTNAEVSAQIYQDVCAQLPGGSNLKILDLYCGIGALSLLLAHKRHRVTGIEINPQAIQMAKRNAERNHIGNVEFVCGDIGKTNPAKWLQGVDAVVVNPPRTGLDRSVCETLSRTHIKHLVYVSCQPATLARDLKILSEGGFELKSVKSYDMFPQTAHVETMVVLEKTLY